MRLDTESPVVVRASAGSCAAFGIIGDGDVFGNRVMVGVE